MNHIERVRRAIKFQKPDCVPLLFFNKDKEQGDIVMIDIQNHFGGEKGRTSEWGFVWDSLDLTMGQPVERLIQSWDEDFKRLNPPRLNLQQRIEHINEQKSKVSDGQYLLASLQLSGFTVMSFLRGFAEMMEDFYAEPENLARLADMIFGFETQLIEIAAKAGLNGIAFFDDWGTQSNLIISPELWRSFFKPRYKAQFECAHRLGLDVYFHSCGKIDKIIGDLFEIGVDMLNLSQPNLYDMAELKKNYGETGCFVIPISYQTTSIFGTREDIFADARLAIESLGCFGGGIIGYIEEYSSIGMSQKNYQSCIDAFRILGIYSKA